MANTDGTALTDFRPLQLSPPKQQAQVLDYFSWVIATYQCREQRVQEPAEAQRIFEEIKSRVWSFGVSPKHIAARELNALPAPRSAADGVPALPELMTFAGGPKGSDLGQKMLHCKDVARRVLEQAYADETQQPTGLIHVSCVGYTAPSAAQEYVVTRGWMDTAVTHSYHMGCYGAFPAVKMAHGYLSDPHQRRVDVVHTEYLSLHADYASLDPGSIVNMTLFADGFIRYSAVPTSDLGGRPGFQIASRYEVIIPDTEQEMTWVPSGHIFEMYLSKDVPLKIKENVRSFTTELCRRAGIDFESQKREMVFAIHPGGPKIVDYIAEELGIAERQLHWSLDVLSERGNMSSATIPHIWARMLGDVRPGTVVVSMAFGPGLTATGLVLVRV